MNNLCDEHHFMLERIFGYCKVLMKMEAEMKKICEELFAPISCVEARVNEGRTSESQGTINLLFF